MDETGHERGTVRASIDFIIVQPRQPELGEVYSREIRLIIRLINCRHPYAARIDLVVLNLIDRLHAIYGLMFITYSIDLFVSQ